MRKCSSRIHRRILIGRLINLIILQNLFLILFHTRCCASKFSIYTQMHIEMQIVCRFGMHGRKRNHTIVTRIKNDFPDNRSLWKLCFGVCQTGDLLDVQTSLIINLVVNTFSNYMDIPSEKSALFTQKMVFTNESLRRKWLLDIFDAEILLYKKKSQSGPLL